MVTGSSVLSLISNQRKVKKVQKQTASDVSPMAKIVSKIQMQWNDSFVAKVESCR